GGGQRRSPAGTGRNSPPPTIAWSRRRPTLPPCSTPSARQGIIDSDPNILAGRFDVGVLKTKNSVKFHDIRRSVIMSDLTRREPIYDPQELERQLVVRENAGDVSGMTALFEPDAVIELNDGRLLRGKEAIHEFFTKLQATGLGP